MGGGERKTWKTRERGRKSKKAIFDSPKIQAVDRSRSL